MRVADIKDSIDGLKSLKWGPERQYKWQWRRRKKWRMEELRAMAEKEDWAEGSGIR